MERCLVHGIMLYAVWLLPISFFDISRRRIPDIFSLGCFASLVLLTLLSGCRPWYFSVVSAAAAAGFLLVLRRINSGSIGLGDVKFAASSGALLPGIQWLLALCLAAFAALLVFLPLMLRGRIGPRFKVPFGPFIGLGTLAAALLSAAGFDLMGI